MVQLQVVVSEQIEVEGTRCVFERAFAALLLFYVLQEVKQYQGGEFGTTALMKSGCAV